MKTSPSIWFVGDPHGDFRQVLELAADRKPDAIILLGDLELPAPLEEVFGPMRRRGIIVRGIHGNHDADTEQLWRHVADGAFAERFNLHGRVETICGVRVAGLGGVFHPAIWCPPGEPLHWSYTAFDRELVPNWWTDQMRVERAAWTASQQLTHRASIFRDVYEQLARSEADVLVTHEAPGRPGMHPHGSEAIDDLAELIGASRAFHGHHHEVRQYPVTAGCRWTGVGPRQIVDLEGKVVADPR